jgi:FkbM family methyltransferase
MSRAHTFEAVAETLAREPKPLRFMASRLLWKSGLCRAFTISRPGYRLRFYPSALSSLLWLDPDGSMFDERIIRRILRPGDTVVDVGANIGTLALCASGCVGESGHVTAIEAHPKTFGFLVGNLHLNEAMNVEALNLAVGEADGEILLTHLNDQKGGTPIHMRPLDALVPGIAPVRLLKIDVEGYELPVLRGAERLLTRTEYVYLECWDRHVERYGYRLSDVMDGLAAAGLKAFRFASPNRLLRVRPNEAFPIRENILAVRDVRAAQEVTGMEFEEQYVTARACAAQTTID